MKMLKYNTYVWVLSDVNKVQKDLHIWLVVVMPQGPLTYNSSHWSNGTNGLGMNSYMHVKIKGITHI